MSVLLYIAFGLICLYLFLRRGNRKNGKEITGPNGWPLVGLGFEIGQQDMFIKFSNYARKYGDIFKINVCGNTFVVLNTSEYIRKAFNDDPYRKVMNDRLPSFYGEEFEHRGNGIAFMKSAYGSNHGALRKGFTMAMHVLGEGKKGFERMINSEVDRMVGEIEACNGEAFDIQYLIRRTLENIISNILAGRDLKTEDEFKALWDYGRNMDFFCSARTDMLMTMFPFLRHLPTVYRERYAEMREAKNNLTKMFFEDTKATYTPGVLRGIVDYIIREQLQDTKEGDDCVFNDDRIICMAVETVVGGIMTTISHLSSTFLILVNHPEYQAKIQSEIDSVIGRDRLPSFDDKMECPFIEAVAMETHRLLPVVPGLLPHKCIADVNFEGYDIPKDSVIIANAFHVHHDEKLWGDPWKFRPERFLDDHGNILPNDHPFRKSWLPFGTGRRQCVAESFARARSFLILTRLLQRYTFEMKPGSHVTYDLRNGADNFNLDLMLRVKPFFCRVVPREAA